MTDTALDDELEELNQAEPNDEAAEQAFIGGLLSSGPRLREHLRMVAPGDYYRPAHTTLHQAFTAMADAGQPVDPLTAAAWLQQSGDLPRVGGAAYLHTCVEALAVLANMPTYARRISRLALRRALIGAGRTITGWGMQPQGDPEELAERAVTLTRDVRDAGRAAEDTPVLDMHDFLAVEDTYDWIVSGLLERLDRLMLTGAEGGGKSVMLRQLAVTIAAGVHPFTHNPTVNGPKRVLVLDCENSAQQSRRQYRKLMNIAERVHRPVRRGQLHIDVRPEGVDLTTAEGRSWLMRRVETVMPDVLVIGPVYQLHAGDPNSEEQARKVTVALTEARLTANCALIMEHHAAKANGLGVRSLAPVGSSLWMRWPEFGFGLRAVEDEKTAAEMRGRRLIPWRGLRDDREFPPFLCQGDTGHWPWKTYQPIDENTGAGW